MWPLFKTGLLIISGIFFIFSIYYDELNMLFVSLLTLYSYCLIFVLQKIQHRIVYLFFLLTFFVYLLGNYIYLFFNEAEWWQPFSAVITRNTIYYLMLSLVSINIGYSIGDYLSRNKNYILRATDSKDLSFYTSLKKISKLVFWVTTLPTLYLIMGKITYSRIYGYVELYKSYKSESIILDKLELINLISFFMYLATMPTKKESRWIILTFVMSAGITLLSGGRTTAITSILIILFYFIYRNNYDSMQLQKDVWLSKRGILSISFLSPIVIIFLSFWGYYRVNMSVKGLTIADLFLGFFKTQGGSVYILSYVQQLKFPSTNISYTFGPIINFLKHNFFTNIFFDFPNYAAQTVEAALYGNNMSFTITYLVMPHNYLAGIGMGSSYIAELIYDFGYWGVLVFNLILGLVLNKFSHIDFRKPWVFTMLLLMLNALLNLPRNVSMIWFVEGINITTIGSICILYLIAKLISNRNVVSTGEKKSHNIKRVFSLSK